MPRNALLRADSSRRRLRRVLRQLSSCGSHYHLTFLWYRLPQHDRDGVQRQQHDQQHDDPRGGRLLERLLRPRRPRVDLHRHDREVSRGIRSPVRMRIRGAGVNGTYWNAPIMISGAVSPIARESARMTPVSMPGSATGRIWPRIVCQRVAPSARAPSRSDVGTARSASCEAMITIGSTSSAIVSAAGQHGPRPRSIARTKSARPRIP